MSGSGPAKPPASTARGSYIYKGALWLVSHKVPSQLSCKQAEARRKSFPQECPARSSRESVLLVSLQERFEVVTSTFSWREHVIIIDIITIIIIVVLSICSSSDDEGVDLCLASPPGAPRSQYSKP